MSKFKKISIVLYFVFVIFFYFFVKDALKDGNIDVSDVAVPEKVEEIKPAVVYLTVDDGMSRKEYRARMKNIDSYVDLLDEMRQNQDFLFEIVDYSYGPKIELVYNIETPQGYEWHAYYEDENITTNIGTTNLTDEGNYSLKLEKI